MIRRLLVSGLAVALSACATGGVYGPGAAAGAAGAGSGEAAGLPDPSGPGAGATAALITQSRSERNAGDLGTAAATIERALTIAPEDATLWMELAEIRFEQGDLDTAGEMARKALTLTAEDSAVAERARRLIGR